ncbi:MAG: M17 family peptidase N-terminal domain-containing protein [Terriglobia bacterium]
MRKFSSLRSLTLLALAISMAGRVLAGPVPAQPQAGGVSTLAKPAEIRIPTGPVRVLVQSPADSVTDLQVICLFQSTPSNTLHGSLIEINGKLNGLLDRIRKPSMFRGELGETMLIIPPAGSLNARKLLVIGLGDSETFTPQRMELVGSILYGEANRLGVAHPFFAPTILDGGVTKFETGQVSEHVVSGFLRGARTERALTDAGALHGQAIQDLTFLAGPAHATDTQRGIERAIAADAIK